MTSSSTPDVGSTRDELLARVAALEAQLRAAPRMGLVWTPQTEEAVTRLATERPLLTPDPAGVLMSPMGPGPGLPHLFVRGENLHFLLELRRSLRGQVDIIYIDPPYNTGSNDFMYNDRFVSLDDAWRHSAWLSFMKCRLELAVDLLAPTGLLAISIDDNEVHHLRMLVESLLGDRAVKTVVVKMSELAGTKMAHKGLPKLKEYLLLAGHGAVPENLEFPRVQKEKWDKNYRQVLTNFTQEQRRRLLELGHGPLADEHTVTDEDVAEVDAMFATVGVESEKAACARDGVDVKDAVALGEWRVNNAWRIIRTTNGGGSVRDLMQERLDRGELADQAIGAIRTPRNILYLAQRKDRYTILFADDYLTTRLGDLWTDISTTGLASEGGVDFKNGKKPQKLLERVLSAVPKRDALVLDFFGGSGSTMEAVIRLNAKDGGTRRCLMATADENNIPSEITVPRLRGILTGALDNGSAREPLPGSVLLGSVGLTSRNAEDSATEHAFSHTEAQFRLQMATGATEVTCGNTPAAFWLGRAGQRLVALWSSPWEPQEEEMEAVSAALKNAAQDGDSQGTMAVRYDAWGRAGWAGAAFPEWEVKDMGEL